MLRSLRAILVAAGALACANATTASAAAPRVVVRVNQVGFTPAAQKRASVLATRPLRGARFAVEQGGHVRLRGALRLVSSHWSGRWPEVYTIDFSRLRRPGRYRILVGAGGSPSFRIAAPSSLYAPLAGDAVSFFQAQRDGAGVVPGRLRRRPAHLLDSAATIYATPSYRDLTLVGGLTPTAVRADVAGGWFDAGDYLKFTGTASFNDVLLLVALRDARRTPALLAEARYGTDWLLKMWDEQRRVLLYQVGIGDGRGDRLLGDHDVWRLPESDDPRRAAPGSPFYFLSHRPVFAANAPGAPISPNLAGRSAAAFALCAQVFASTDPAYARRCLGAGQTLFDQAAQQWRGPLVSSTPGAYYTEPTWRDDMTLGATELYLATRAVDARGLPHPDADDYLEPAATWADAYMSGARAGQDSLNLYDVSGLADYDLYRVMVATGHRDDLETDASKVLGDLHDQLALGSRLAARDSFSLADPNGLTDTVPHALGYAIEARLYDSLTATRGFEPLAQAQLDWVLGRNAWGSSFVVGAGSTFPHCLASQIANLRGSLDGRGPILAGATVGGPTAAGDLTGLGAPDGYHACPRGPDRFAGFDGAGFGYRDDVRSPDTSEPTDDYTALSLLAFAEAAYGAGHT